MKLTIVTVLPDEHVTIENIDPDTVMPLIEDFENGWSSVLHFSLDDNCETYILRSNIVRIDVETGVTP